MKRNSNERSEPSQITKWNAGFIMMNFFNVCYSDQKATQMTKCQMMSHAGPGPTQDEGKANPAPARALLLPHPGRGEGRGARGAQAPGPGMNMGSGTNVLERSLI